MGVSVFNYVNCMSNSKNTADDYIQQYYPKQTTGHNICSIRQQGFDLYMTVTGTHSFPQISCHDVSDEIISLKCSCYVIVQL